MSDNGVTPSGSGHQPSASAADASSRSGVPNAVTVTAADWNGDSFDGSPFDPAPAPDWLIEAIRAKRVEGDCPGSTDYAVWWVHALYGKVLAEPGDKIIRHDDGTLGVVRWKSGEQA